MLLLFVIVGYGVGLFVLLRQNWVVWKQPLVFGIITGFLLFLSSVNEWPSSWMEYDTAETASSFMLGNLITSLTTFVLSSVWFVFSFMAAECLTRRAFPDHIQIWKLWTFGDSHCEGMAYSWAVIGRIVRYHFFDWFCSVLLIFSSLGLSDCWIHARAHLFCLWYWALHA